MPDPSIAISNPIVLKAEQEHSGGVTTTAHLASELVEKAPSCGTNRSAVTSICDAEETHQPSRCYPKTCSGQPIFRGNPEALAWAIDNCVTVLSYVGIGAFLGTVRLSQLTLWY